MLFARTLLFIGLVSAGLLLILLTTTTPARAGAFGILAVFLLSYVVVLVATTLTLWSIASLTDKMAKKSRRPSRKSYAIDIKRAYYFSTVIASGPVILISLNSVGGVSIYEFGLVALFVMLGCLYVARRAS